MRRCRLFQYLKNLQEAAVMTDVPLMIGQCNQYICWNLGRLCEHAQCADRRTDSGMSEKSQKPMWANMSQYPGISPSAEGVGHQFRRCLISVVSWGQHDYLILTTALTGKIGVHWAYHMDHVFHFFISIVSYNQADVPCFVILLKFTCSCNFISNSRLETTRINLGRYNACVQDLIVCRPTAPLQHCRCLRLRLPQAIPSIF